MFEALTKQYVDKKQQKKMSHDVVFSFVNSIQPRNSWERQSLWGILYIREQYLTLEIDGNSACLSLTSYLVSDEDKVSGTKNQARYGRSAWKRHLMRG